MITASNPNRLSSRRHARAESGLTLIEMVVTAFVFGLVLMGAIYTQQIGLQNDQLVQSKLGASYYSRQGFDKLTSDIRSAIMWQIGTGTGSTFTPVGTTNCLQSGNALQINLTAATNNYICYYFNTNLQQLIRWQNGVSGTYMVAQYLTNTMVFNAEDYLGNAATTRSYKNVIHVIFQFWQYQYPTTLVGSNSYYNYYKLEFRVTPHCPVWPP